MKKLLAAVFLVSASEGLVFAEVLLDASGAAAMSAGAAAAGDLESARDLSAVPFSSGAADRTAVVEAGSGAGVQTPDGAAGPAEASASPRAETAPPAPSRTSGKNLSGWGRLGRGLLGAGLIAGGVGLIAAASTLAFPIGIGLAAVGGAAMIYAMAAGDDRAGVTGMGLAAVGGFSLIPAIGGLALGPWWAGGMLAVAGAILTYQAVTGKDLR